MGPSSARKYRRNQARLVADGIGRIRDRINPKYTPVWMMKELDEIYRRAQGNTKEWEWIMEGFGDEI